ncbi:unnamed protein product [Dovyalis caffra]|uniref:Uncharacterized protein n=1 Tax=Dovyalis caffra TaxID=77055 RepID=A0AAV1SR85_9ROSI|nr:unnamed protein product [Dovyalis caffra]
MKFFGRLGSCCFSTTTIAAAPEAEDADGVEEVAATTEINGDVPLLTPGCGRRSRSRGRGSWRPALSAISEDRMVSFRRRKPGDQSSEKKAAKAHATKVMKNSDTQSFAMQMSFSGFTPTPAPLEINNSKMPSADSTSFTFSRDCLNKESSYMVLRRSLETINTTWREIWLENNANIGRSTEGYAATSVFEGNSMFKLKVSSSMIEIHIATHQCRIGIKFIERVCSYS